MMDYNPKQETSMTIQYLKRENQPTLAYVYTPPSGDGAQWPVVMFCGGYRSDMGGTKATWLEEQCRARGQGYVRFDYAGHGESGGAFEDGTIGSWFEDALAVFDAVIGGQVILVGSSMGGWITMLLARARAERIAGLIGIAAAPDFTESLYESLPAAQKDMMHDKGYAEIPNDYSDEPYHFTKALYEDGKGHLLLRETHRVSYPMRLIHGSLDKDVPESVPARIQDVYQGDVEIITIADGDHRLSRPEDLAIIDREIRRI